MQRVKAGDRAAEAALVERYSKGLLSLMRVRVKDNHLAEDLHQETFRIVIERLRDTGINDPSKLPHFINRTAINLYIGHLRKEDRRKTTANSDLVDSQLDTGLTPIQKVMNNQGSRLVGELLGELATPRDQEILKRFYIFEETKESICASLDLSPAHFNRVISRARKRFQSIIETKAPDLIA